MKQNIPEEEEDSESGEIDYRYEEDDDDDSAISVTSQSSQDDSLLPNPLNRGGPLVEEELIYDLPNMDEYSDQEKDLLPMSHFKGQSQQWEYILEAVGSNFSSVSKLDKVSDKTLEMFTDIIQIKQKTNKAIYDIFRMYENQRMNGK